MKNFRRYQVFILTLLMLSFSTTMVFAADTAEANASKFGIWTILPPLVAILFLIPAYIFWNIGVAHYKSTGS